MPTSTISLQSSDLNENGSIACPNPKTGFHNATAHPRVFLCFKSKPRVECPYCGTVYVLAQDDEATKSAN